MNRWRVEVNDPRKSDDWNLLRQFEEDQYTAHQELIEELNQLNAPIQLRLAPDDDPDQGQNVT